MSVYINFVCDQENCKNCQSANFDFLGETWLDMINAMVDIGWKFQLDEAKIIKSKCPDHKDEKE